MPKFIVNVREVWVQPVAIEAIDEKEAIAKVIEGEGDYEPSGEYSSTMDSSTWTVAPVITR